MNMDKIVSYALASAFFVLPALILVEVLNPPSEQEISEQRAETQKRYLDETIKNSLELANEVVYVQDARTGICFASRTVKGWHGHFTTVDCDMIPSNMLHTTE